MKLLTVYNRRTALRSTGRVAIQLIVKLKQVAEEILLDEYNALLQYLI